LAHVHERPVRNSVEIYGRHSGVDLIPFDNPKSRRPKNRREHVASKVEGSHRVFGFVVRRNHIDPERTSERNDDVEFRSDVGAIRQERKGSFENGSRFNVGRFFEAETFAIRRILGYDANAGERHGRGESVLDHDFQFHLFVGFERIVEELYFDADASPDGFAYVDEAGRSVFESFVPFHRRIADRGAFGLGRQSGFDGRQRGFGVIDGKPFIVDPVPLPSSGNNLLRDSALPFDRLWVGDDTTNRHLKSAKNFRNSLESKFFSPSE